MATNIDPAYILFGMKHSGKTTQGRLLAEKISYAFIDIDEVITKQTGYTPREIYSEFGPQKFMSTEEQICKLCNEKFCGKKIVIATGGGICDNAPAIALLRDLGTFIFLSVPEQIILERILEHTHIEADGTLSNLPAYIAKKNPETEEDVRKIFNTFYAERTATYAAFTDICIPLEAVPPEENFKTLCKLLGI